jgi:type II secretory pathway pseudopilin PulG
MKSLKQSGFTLAELLVAATVGVAITLGMVSFSWSASRLGAKNLAYNHGASSFTQASNRLVKDAQSSASIFTLVDFNGSTYTDSSATVSSDKDPLTSQYLSARSNAVRFWKQIGGPFQLNVDSLPASTNLSFNFGPAVNGALPYTPTVNDKLWFPLLDEEFQITAIVTAPTVASPTGVVTINSTSRVGTGYTLSTTSPNVTTAIFYRQVAYSVYNYNLRYHPNYSNAPSTCADVCYNITSPKPFSVLYQTSTSSSSSRTDLRVSFEAYDLKYSNINFPNGAGTLQTIISIRDQPPFVSALQTPL